MEKGGIVARAEGTNFHDRYSELGYNSSDRFRQQTVPPDKED